MFNEETKQPLNTFQLTGKMEDGSKYNPLSGQFEGDLDFREEEEVKL